MSYRITAAPAAANNTTAASAAVNNEAAAPAAANNGANTKITKEYDPLKTFHNEYFSPDYIKNNPLLIFITSQDNKFAPLTVYTIIRGSIKLKQTLCSENYFLWGGANSSQLQFECCSSDLIDNAPDGKIQLQLVPTIYEEGKLKQILDEKKVTIFTGYVESAEPTKTPGNWKITAYDRFYRMRNVPISPWLKSLIETYKSGGQHASWNDVLTMIETQLGFGACIHPDWMSSMWYPDNADITQQNGVNMIKNFALLMQRFAMIDGDGALQYVEVEDSVTTQNYYCLNTWSPDELKYSAGHIWMPRLFTSEPRTNIFYTTGETTPEDDYYNNIYTIKSPILGNASWIDECYECDAYGAPSSKYSAANMPAGLFDTKRLCLTHGETFSQQQYSIRAHGADPTIPMGSQILVNRFNKESGWSNVVASYIMQRTLTIMSPTYIIADYSAENEPYNSVVPEYEAGVQSANALANQVSKNLPFIVDGSSQTKMKVICAMSADDYKNLSSDEKRSDTIYCVRGEVSSS